MQKPKVSTITRREGTTTWQEVLTFQPYFRPFLCTFIFVLFFNFNFVQGFLWGPWAKINSELRVSAYTQNRGKWDRTWGQGCVYVASSTICKGVCDFCLQALVRSKRLQTCLSNIIFQNEACDFRSMIITLLRVRYLQNIKCLSESNNPNCYLILFWSAL